MGAGPTEVNQVPLFAGIDDDGLKKLLATFERQAVETGHKLFGSDQTAKHLYILLEGRVSLRGGDSDRQIVVQAISPIGELGAMTGLPRRVTAVAQEPSVLLRATAGQLTAFFAENSQVAVTFYQNLLGMVADKIRRDERRGDDMRRNIITTQKSLKQLRELILDNPITSVSEPTHDMLESLIRQNRRANYVVEPPNVLPASVRLPDGQVFPVVQMSRQFVVLPAAATRGANGDWRGVLVLPSTEIPIGGSVGEEVETEGRRINLDLLIEEYSARLEDYLTRAQLLDIVL